MSYVSIHSNVNEGEPNWKTEIDIYDNVTMDGSEGKRDEGGSDDYK